MSHAQSKRYAKSRAAQSCARPVASERTRRGSVRACSNIFHFPPSGISLPGTSAAIEGASFRWGSKDRLHSKAFSDFGRETPGLCIFDRADIERNCQPCCYEVAGPRVRTWLKNRWMASKWPFGWNISLIACWPKSSLKLMNCWCLNDADGRIKSLSVARRS